MTRGSCAFLVRRMFEGLIGSGGERSEEWRMQRGDVDRLKDIRCDDDLTMSQSPPQKAEKTIHHRHYGPGKTSQN